jgi:hypothetical protein
VWYTMTNASVARPKILISNDDGVNAPGLRALVKALAASQIADVYVCAPAGERSATSHAITLGRYLSCYRCEVPGAVEAFAVDGTPADSVMLALNGPVFDLEVRAMKTSYRLAMPRATILTTQQPTCRKGRGSTWWRLASTAVTTAGCMWCIQAPWELLGKPLVRCAFWLPPVGSLPRPPPPPSPPPTISPQSSPL